MHGSEALGDCWKERGKGKRGGEGGVLGLCGMGDGGCGLAKVKPSYH